MTRSGPERVFSIQSSVVINFCTLRAGWICRCWHCSTARDDGLSLERGCVVLDQPQHSRIATRAGVFRCSNPVTALRLVEDDTAALQRHYYQVAQKMRCSRDQSSVVFSVESSTVGSA